MISIGLKHTYLLSIEKQWSFPVIAAALISYSQASLQHNDLKKKKAPMNEMKVPAPTWWLFSLLFLFLNRETRRTPLLVYSSSPETQREREREKEKVIPSLLINHKLLHVQLLFIQHYSFFPLSFSSLMLRSDCLNHTVRLKSSP